MGRREIVWPSTTTAPTRRLNDGEQQQNHSGVLVANGRRVTLRNSSAGRFRSCTAACEAVTHVRRGTR